jgi:hypothetical protein
MQLEEAAAKAAAHAEALQAEHSSLQAALQEAQGDVQAQHDHTAKAEGAAQQAATEQEAYVQMVRLKGLWPTYLSRGSKLNMFINNRCRYTS